MFDDNKPTMFPSRLITPAIPFEVTPSPIPFQLAPLAQVQQLKAQTLNLEKDMVAVMEVVKEMKQENEEKDAKIAELMDRVEILRLNSERSDSRRRAAVTQLSTMRTRHQQASATFEMRCREIESEDLENMLVAWGNSITTAVNHQQQALRYVATVGVQAPYGPPVYQQPAVHQQQHVHQQQPVHQQPAVQVAYGPYAFAFQQNKYDAQGLCMVHSCPYPCGQCGF